MMKKTSLRIEKQPGPIITFNETDIYKNEKSSRFIITIDKTNNFMVVKVTKFIISYEANTALREMQLGLP